jgi:hypothetical protein
MICSNCGSPRTRYVKTVNENSKSFSREFLVKDEKVVLEIYKCVTCGGVFNIKK